MWPTVLLTCCSFVLNIASADVLERHHQIVIDGWATTDLVRTVNSLAEAILIRAHTSVLLLHHVEDFRFFELFRRFVNRLFAEAALRLQRIV